MSNESGRENIDPRLLNLIDKSENMSWLFVKSLKRGDVLEVQTKNTLYAMKVLNPETGEVLVNSNGSTVTKESKGIVTGTTLTGYGTMVKIGGITIGFRLVLWVQDLGEAILTATQEVRVNGVKVLPTARKR